MFGVKRSIVLLFTSFFLFSSYTFAGLDDDLLESYKKGAHIETFGSCDNGKSPLILLTKDATYVYMLIFSPGRNANKMFYFVKKDTIEAHNEYFVKDFSPDGTGIVRKVGKLAWASELLPLSLNFWNYLFGRKNNDCFVTPVYP